MVWINLILFILKIDAAEPQRFLTKHSPDTLRYISMDGRFAYVQKRPGVLGLVSSFRSVEFLSETNSSDFLVKASGTKSRVVIESISNIHTEMNLMRDHKIYVADYGNTVTRHIGYGRNAKLHLKDEWISFFHQETRVIHIQNLVTQKKYEIKLSGKTQPFFLPDVEMISSKTIVYTDLNEAGYAALISYDFESLNSTVIYKTNQNASRLEICKSSDYLALGEFPYEGVSRGSKIQTLPLTDSINLAGFTTAYSSIEQDVGNIVCLPQKIYFVKTMNHDKVLNHKVTEAVMLDLKSQNVEAKSELKSVSQILEMDQRVIIPFRGQLLVIEGTANIGDDTLKTNSPKEELQIDI
jgi:hypothetical protein